MIDLNTNSWAHVAADKSKKNTHKTELGWGPPSHGCLSSSPSPFVCGWRDLNVGFFDAEALVARSGRLVAGGVHTGLKRSTLAALSGISVAPAPLVTNVDRCSTFQPIIDCLSQGIPKSGLVSQNVLLEFPKFLWLIKASSGTGERLRSPNNDGSLWGEFSARGYPQRRPQVWAWIVWHTEKICLNVWSERERSPATVSAAQRARSHMNAKLCLDSLHKVPLLHCKHRPALVAWC